MGGYANRRITLEFPELSEPDDMVRLTIRNPRTMAPAELGVEDVDLDSAGRPTSSDAAAAATYKMIARMVIGWHVYDATSVEEEQPLLPLPATPELVSKLPVEIITRIGEMLTEAVNPQ